MLYTQSSQRLNAAVICTSRKRCINMQTHDLIWNESWQYTEHGFAIQCYRLTTVRHSFIYSWNQVKKMPLELEKYGSSWTIVNDVCDNKNERTKLECSIFTFCLIWIQIQMRCVCVCVCIFLCWYLGSAIRHYGSVCMCAWHNKIVVV